MSMAGLKITLKSYFDFNCVYVTIIALLIFGGLYSFMRKKNESSERSVAKKEMLWGLALSVYMALLIGGTLLNRGIGDEYQMELMPFWSYRKFVAEGNTALLGQMVCNVLIFMPWSILFAKIFPIMKKFWLSVGSAFVFSVLIEVTQFVLKCGLFEFDDIFHNVLGAVIGYGSLAIYRYYKQKGANK